MPGRRRNYFLLLVNVLRSLNLRGPRLEVPKIDTEVTLQAGAAVQMVGTDLGPAHRAKRGTVMTVYVTLSNQE